ncbi:unnamed protein product [Caenorhabditis angaria]|uniref:C2H2-type domain-containing protein n=1 Tax=Caenorhabditis angaria TaxID=860376 RepID=A0A9P1IM34_9PELO|nr:unnamed protein product [Caenorhabditis angaria]
MSEDGQSSSDSFSIRRSSRCKQKPAPKYVYDYKEFYDKNAIVVKKLKLPKKKLISQIKKSDRNKKYDDIFSSVVQSAKYIDSLDESSSENNSEDEYERLINQLDRELEKEEKRNSQENPIEDTNIVIRRQESEENLEPEIVEIVRFVCSCKNEFEDHLECHKHIIDNHSNSTFYQCSDCGMNYDRIHKNNVCFICNEFTLNLMDHLSNHYRDSTNHRAVMECRFCTRQFLTVTEVIEHEEAKHGNNRKFRNYKKAVCPECGLEATYRENLISHYNEHFSVELLFELVSQLQGRMRIEKEDCPFCRSLMVSNRKAFRKHLLHMHYDACKALLADKTMESQKSDLEVKKEVFEMTEASTIPMKRIKTEVKQELLDEDYPHF